MKLLSGQVSEPNSEIPVERFLISRTEACLPVFYRQKTGF